MRMEEDEIKKKVPNEMPSRKLNKARTKMRWIDGVSKDTRILGAKNWTTITKN